MNFEHAVQTIAKRGFTDRQARFLVLVARHSGVCVMRQYSTFAGIVFGQKTRKFFAKLVRARVRFDIRLRAQPRTRLSRASSSDLRGHRRAGQPAPTASRRAPRARASDAAGRDSGEPREHLDVVVSREGGLPLEPRDSPRRRPASGHPTGRSAAGSATSPIASRSASIHPATSSSSTSTPTRCATSSATSSSVTRRCSSGCPRGQSESWFRRTCRPRRRTCRRSRGGSSPRHSRSQS